MANYNQNDNYDERLLSYITEYTRTVGVPPTVDLMLANVKGRTSKSTVHYRCQKMVDAGLLTQKNVKGYYYPTSMDVCEVSVPRHLLEQAYKVLSASTETAALADNISSYLSTTAEDH